MKCWLEYCLAKHKKHFGRINIGNLDKIISYMFLICSLELFFDVRMLELFFDVRMLPKWHSRYGSQSTSAEYLHVSALSLAYTDGAISCQFRL